MSERRGTRPPVLVLAGLILTLVLAGCTTSTGNGDDAQGAGAAASVAVTGDDAAASVPVTDGAGTGSAGADQSGPGEPVVAPTAESSAPGGITVVAPADGTDPAADRPASSDPAATAPKTSAGPKTAPAKSSPAKSTPSKTAPKKAVPKKAPKVRVDFRPLNRKIRVSPLAPIKVSSAGGLLQNVRVFNPEGKIVYHGINIRRNNWAVDPELGFNRKYRIVVDSKNKDGVLQRDEASFTTLKASALLRAHIFPSGNQRVGVGQPIQITFNEPIHGAKAKAAVERMITVTPQSKQSGKFRWYSDTEVRWRPLSYFRPMINVQVSVKIYGRQISGGLFGGEDTRARFVVSRSMVSEVDASAHQMVVKVNGAVVTKIPVSLGNDKYPTYNGVHVVTERLPTHVMDSSTWGLTGVGAYRTRVKWATRISNTGEFVHGAPWSVYAQGNTNVSHGCINMTDAAAKWFMQKSLPGDVVTVKNSKGSTLKSWDGYGDWNLPWAKY